MFVQKGAPCVIFVELGSFVNCSEVGPLGTLRNELCPIVGMFIGFCGRMRRDLHVFGRVGESFVPFRVGSFRGAEDEGGLGRLFRILFFTSPGCLVGAIVGGPCLGCCAAFPFAVVVQSRRRLGSPSGVLGVGGLGLIFLGLFLIGLVLGVLCLPLFVCWWWFEFGLFRLGW